MVEVKLKKNFRSIYWIYHSLMYNVLQELAKQKYVPAKILAFYRKHFTTEITPAIYVIVQYFSRLQRDVVLFIVSLVNKCFMIHCQLILRTIQR